MGIVLTTAGVLALAAVFIEVRLFKSVKPLRKASERSDAAGISMSMFLSWFIGMIFNAGGLVVMVASMISTVITMPIHGYARYKSKITQEQRDTVEAYKRTYSPLLKLVKFVIKLILSPIWLPVQINKRMNSSKELRSI